MEVVAVDWSGAAVGASTRIWLAHVVGGELVALRNGRSRQQVTDDLVALRAGSPDGLVVGLDFSFSLPAWFLRAHSCAVVEDLWRIAEAMGEQWLAECVPPFWGRPGCPRPTLSDEFGPVGELGELGELDVLKELGESSQFRRAEQAISVGGIRPKSTFQIGGAGAVGTGTIRGMPHLRQLRAAGFGIWPFDPPSPWTVLEIYPRLLTGPVRKSDRAQRTRYVEATPWAVAPAFAESMVGSDDAFDAAISALVMYDHLEDLAGLAQTADPVTLLEGNVWRPPKIEA
jgi:hypothetical protein